ncbi:PQQ-binding-like beta-propeller repeat protein [Halapricum sp. CBA1109]|uniref:outer membrane protein assembly factor BamB family protein n=1 Tax=Halapricum sp. CBA1109 TaxID=2668068 RepID=UPI0012F8925C|nr:PQQ-binding-like beta-propeller repeat protein [Halapricum sp. CBA1109]MUV89258.1 PQQ-binding-like beta-propeller repeat protein [Halapricum sp. CBA1109]
MDRRAFLGATAGVVALAGCSNDGERTDEAESGAPTVEPSGSWPSYQRTRFNTGATDPGSPPTSSVSEAWTFETDDQIVTASAIHNGTVYVPSEDEHLYALSLEDGTEQWAFDAGTGLYNQSPAVAGQTVYQTNENGALFALDTETGEPRWEYDAGEHVPRGAAVSTTGVFFGDNDDTVYAVDRETGEERWTYRTAGGIQSVPTYHDRAVYVSSIDDHVYKLDAESGEEVWNHRTDNRPGSPTVYDGTVYTSTTEGTMYALDAADGSELWTAVAGGMDDNPTVSEDRIFGDSTYAVDVWDRESGARSADVVETDGIGDTTALVDDTLFLASEDAVVRAIDVTDGTELWRHDVGYAAEVSPAVGEGYVVVGTIRGEVHALH